MAESIAAYWHIIIILLAFVVVGWLLWPQPIGPAAPEAPKIEPSAPKAVVDLAREMPKATEPVALVGGAPVTKPVSKPAAKPVAKVAAKAKAAPVAAPKPAAKPKAAPVKVAAVKTAAAPKAKAEPVKAKPAPVAKVAKAAPAPKAETAPKAPVAAKPAPKPAPKPKAAATAKPAPKPTPKPIIPDNLELLKGVGPKLNTLLKSLGVTGFEQVAGWSPADIDEIDARLGNFAGRIRRDNWVDQAKLLVAGDIKGFEKKYGALGSEITG